MATALFLLKLLFIKAALLGVVPFRFRLYRVTLEPRKLLLSYCFLVSLAGQTMRLVMNTFWSWNFALESSFLRVTAIIAYLCESMLLALPVFLLLLYQVNVIEFFNQLKQLYYCPLLAGRVRLEKWLLKCFKYNCLYDVVYIATMVVYGLLSNDFPADVMLPYITCLILTTFAKGIVLLIMYGVGQYLLIVSQTINELLMLTDQTTYQETYKGLVQLYEQLWKCCEFFNSLFGIPIVCYLTLFSMHTITVLYELSSLFLLGKQKLTSAEIALSVEEIAWAICDVMYVMLIIGTCSLVKREILEMIGDKVINRLLLVSFVLAIVSGILSITFDRKAKELRVSKILVVYSIILALGCTALYQSTQFLLSSARYKGSLTTSVNLVIGTIQGQVVLHTFMTAALQRYQKRNHVAILLKELYQLKIELFSTIELGMRWMKLRILRKIMLSQLIITSSFVLAIVELVISDHENLENELLLLCVFYYPKVAIVYSVSLHYAVMMYLQNLHYALNERMKQLLLEHTIGSAENSKGYARTQHSVYMRSKLNHLSDARCRIASCCNKTHAFYEQLLLNCCFLCMTFIVSQMYHFFEILYLNYRAQTSLSISGLAHETLTCVLCFYELYSIMNACEMVREQSRKTQTLLLRLNFTKIDHKLKQSIEVFALQTLHQPIEFTASRMFTLDYTVLFSIIASVTSYLIILIQFELAVEQ